MSSSPKLLVHVLNEVARDSEANAFAAAGLRQDKRIDPHKLPSDVDQSASAVAGVDGCVGLDVGDGVVVAHLPGGSADHAHRHRVFQTQWTADRQNDVPLLEGIRIAERQRLQTAAFHLDEGKVCFRIDANDARVDRRCAAPSRWRRLAGRRTEHNLYADGSANDVGVGHDVPIRIDDHPRAGCLLAGHQGNIPALPFFDRAVAVDFDLDHRG